MPKKYDSDRLKGISAPIKKKFSPYPIRENKSNLVPKPKTKGASNPSPSRMPKNKSMPKKRGTPTTTSSSSSKSGPNKAPNAERKAHRLANGVIRREVKDLKQQSNQITRASDNAIGDTETRYQRGVGDLNALRTETDEFLTSMNGQNNATFDAAKAEQTAASAALQQQLGTINGNAISGVNSELSGLGIGGEMAGGFTQGLTDAGQFNQGQAAVQGAGAMSTLNAMNSNTNQLNGILQGMTQGSFVTNLGKNLNDRNDSLGNIQAETMDQQGLVREAITDARGSRKDVFFELLNQLQQTGWGTKSKSNSSSQAQGPSQGPSKFNSVGSPGAKASLAKQKPKQKPKPHGGRQAVAMSNSQVKKFDTKGKKAYALDNFDLKKFDKKNR